MAPSFFFFFFPTEPSVKSPRALVKERLKTFRREPMNQFMHSEQTDIFITSIGYSVSKTKKSLKQTQGGLIKTPVGFGI